MIEIFLGEDTQGARKEARVAFELARERNPESFVSYFDDLLFDFSKASEALSSESLFSGANIIYFDGILDHPEGETFYRTILRETDHLVFVREAKTPKEIKAFLERIGIIKDFPLKKTPQVLENTFAIADAIGMHDKKKMWVEYEKMRKNGHSAEEIHGIVFWAIKSICLALFLSKQDALRSGMKEFTYRNYSQYAKNHQREATRNRLRELRDIYHKGHRGEVDFDFSLEKFLLTF